jgi:type II secretory pathway component PulF
MYTRDSSAEILEETDSSEEDLKKILSSFNSNVVKLAKALENTQNIQKSCKKINKLLKERHGDQK